MDVVYVHGPERTPFDVAPDGAVVAAGGTPFHGIVLRGLHAVKGRLASAGEREAIEETIEAVLAAATPEVPVSLDVNHGDVVWDGTRAHVVAIG